MTQSFDEQFAPKAMTLDELFAAIRPPPLLPLGYGTSDNSASTPASFASGASTAQPTPTDRFWAGVRPGPADSSGLQLAQNYPMPQLASPAGQTRTFDDLYAPKAMSLDELFAAIRPPPLLPVRYEPSDNSSSAPTSFTSAANMPQPIPPDRLSAGVQPNPLAALNYPNTQEAGPSLHTIPDPVISPEHLWYLIKPAPLRQSTFGERVVDNTLDLAGKIWNLPNTAVGTAYGGLGYAAGLLAGRDPRIGFDHNGIEFRNNPLINSHDAVTLGNAISYGRNAGPEDWGSYNDPNVKFGPHEEGHTYQGQVLGPLFVPAWLLSHGYRGLGSIFEDAAQRYGAGKGSWWP